MRSLETFTYHVSPDIKKSFVYEISGNILFESKRCLINPFQTFECEDVKTLYKNSEVRKYLGGNPSKDSIKCTLKEIVQRK